MNKMELDVKLLYVEQFEPKFLTPPTHPKAGHVYRAIKREAPAIGNFYQLLYDNPEDSNNIGLFLPKLKMDSPFYTCNIREVAPEDLLELDLDDSAFERISKWGVDYKKGIDDELLNIPVINDIDNTQNIPIEKFIKEMARGVASAMDENKNKERTRYVGMDGIKDADPTMHAVLIDLTSYLWNTYGDKYENSPMGKPAQTMLKSNEFGKGASMFTALKYLQRYVTTGFNKSGNPSDLLKAIHYILFELNRLKINGDI